MMNYITDYKCRVPFRNVLVDDGRKYTPADGPFMKTASIEKSQERSLNFQKIPIRNAE